MHRTAPTTAAIIAALALTACASHPYNISWRNAEEMQATPTATLCYAYVNGGDSKALVSELERRKAFSDAEWSAISRHRVFVGMQRDAVICSWNKPPTVKPQDGGAELWIYPFRRDVTIDASGKVQRFNDPS